MTVDDTKVRVEFSHDERVVSLILAAPKANVLDKSMTTQLTKALVSLHERKVLRAIVVRPEGPHFSFGASVEEHLPEQIAGALARLRALLTALLEAPAPTIAAVRGQCLGGGLELALGCDLILAEENASLGLPEIKLAVFPPAGAALLPPRIGASRAARLVLQGCSLSGSEALAAGLVAVAAPAGELDAKLDELLENDFLSRSAAALRYAAKASRRSLLVAVNEDLPELEHLYLEELMAQPDAEEGIRAFLEKRTPRYQGGEGRSS
jgi:cyclohexa-1,5-dienecarbonyl-CoA hydratase